MGAGWLVAVAVGAFQRQTVAVGPSRPTGAPRADFTLSVLAKELQAQGNYDEAEPRYREALEIYRVTLGGRHQNTVAAINNLGMPLYSKAISLLIPSHCNARRWRYRPILSAIASKHAHCHQQPRPAVARQGQPRRR